jgi:hypothetical protein
MLPIDDDLVGSDYDCDREDFDILSDPAPNSSRIPQENLAVDYEQAATELQLMAREYKNLEMAMVQSMEQLVMPHMEHYHSYLEYIRY